MAEQDTLVDLSLMQRAADSVTFAACYYIKQEYGPNPRKPNPVLAYHNLDLTREVIDLTIKLLESLQQIAPDAVKDEDLLMGQIAAAFCDFIQVGTIWQMANPYLTSHTRLAGIKENLSANQATEHMEFANQLLGSQVFSDRFILIVQNAILATEFGYLADFRTIYHPKADEFSDLSPAIACLTFADSNGAGLIGPSAAIRTLRRSTRETWPVMTEALGNTNSIRDLSHQEQIRSHLALGIYNHVQFVEGRKSLLNKELQRLNSFCTDSQIAEFGRVFSHFDESIAALTELSAQAQDWSLEQLAEWYLQDQPN